MAKLNIRKVLHSHHCQQRARVAGYFNEDAQSIITPEAVACGDVEYILDPLALSVLLDPNNKLVPSNFPPGPLVSLFQILKLFGSL